MKKYRVCKLLEIRMIPFGFQYAVFQAAICRLLPPKRRHIAGREMMSLFFIGLIRPIGLIGLIRLIRLIWLIRQVGLFCLIGLIGLIRRISLISPISLIIWSVLCRLMIKTPKQCGVTIIMIKFA